MRAAVLVAVLVGCGGPERPAKPKPPVEADACSRFCSRLDACNVLPMQCETQCARDLRKMRAGVVPAMVDCVERELPETACTTLAVVERRSRVSLCWAATLEAWSSEDKNRALGRIVRAVCARAARCEPEEEKNAQACAATLEQKLASKAQSKMLAVAKPELVESLAACVEKASCEVDDVIGVCSTKEDEG